MSGTILEYNTAKPYYRNPRRITKARLKKLADNLQRYGDLSGVVHNLRNNQIVGGNQRTTVFQQAAKIEIVERYDQPDAQGTVALGYIVYNGAKYNYRQVDWDAETESAANLVANTDAGLWDFDIVANQWQPAELVEFAGWTPELLKTERQFASALDNFLRSEQPDPVDAEPQIDRAEELRVKWGVELGQMWQLGDHRLICGDCTDPAVVERVMGGELCELVVTDPPYGVSYADKNKFLNAISFANRIETPIENDHKTKAETQKMWKAAFCEMFKIMQPGAVVYCFMPQGGDQMMMMMMMMMEAGIEPRHEIIWLKNNHVLGRVDYAYKHEPILYAWKEGGHKFYGDFQTSILEFDRPNISDMHPTTKPVLLVERLIKNSSVADGIVYDPFSGSGTTLIACENLSRRCRAVEISPVYVAVALERWAAVTGRTPELME